VKEQDEKILNGLRNSSEKALKALFDTYYNPLFYIARQYLYDDFAAETIVSDLFCRLWEERNSIKIQTSLQSYLFKSVRNLSLNYIRDNYKYNKLSINDLDITSPLLFTSDEYPLGKLLEKELSEKVYKEIQALPSETRQVFVLSRLKGRKNTEIATELGISINTVKYHMKRALTILRERLKDFLTLLFLFLLGNS